METVACPLPGINSVRNPSAPFRRGMTLVEVMLGMFVLVFVLGGSLTAIIRTAALARDSKVVYRETAIINDLVERMRSMTYTELKAELQSGNSALGVTVSPTKTNTTCGSVPPTTPSGAGTGPVLAGSYSYRWERSFTDISVDPLRITVTAWAEGLEAKKLTVVTYISASGLINK